MTTTQATNTDEIKAVDLSDGYAEEALQAAKHAAPGEEHATPGERAITYALLAIKASIDAHRESQNRELPDIAAAIADARQD